MQICVQLNEIPSTMKSKEQLTKLGKESKGLYRNVEKESQGLYRKIADNDIPRNIVLALCTLIIVVAIISICLSIYTRHNSHIEVPEFLGMELNEATHAARKANLRLTVSDSLYVPSYAGGVILKQTPAAGSEVKGRRHIFVTVNSYRQKQVEVPYVTGYSLRQAKNVLELAGLEITEIKYKQDIATNNVLEERVGTQVVTSKSKIKTDTDSGVILVVGRNGSLDENVRVPKLIGLTLSNAKNNLWDSGLNVGEIKYDPNINLLDRKDARIYSQTPGQAENAKIGSTVTLLLTLDNDKVTKSGNESDRNAKRLIEKNLKQATDTLTAPEVTATSDQEVLD